MRSLRLFLRNLAAYLWAAKIGCGVLFAAVAMHFFSCGTLAYFNTGVPPQQVDAARLWGTVLQLLGIGTIAYGLHRRLETHTGRGLFPTSWRSVLGEWRRIRGLWPTSVVISAQGAAFVSVFGRAHATVGLSPNASIEERLSKLEDQHRKIDGFADELERRLLDCDTRLNKLQEGMTKLEDEITRKIGDASVSGYATELSGAVLLALGVWYGTSPILICMACRVG